MKSILLLLLALLLSLATSFTVLKGDNIPKNYEIGKFDYIDFGSDGRIFFKTRNDTMGFLNARNGKLLVVYELDEGETIMDYKGNGEMIIVYKKTANMFIPSKEQYYKLKLSDYLEKQKF